MPTNCLLDAPKDIELKLINVDSGVEARRKLTSMGIHFSDKIIKLNSAKWGPVLVRNVANGTNKLAIGRGLAKKIMVEYE